MKTLLLALVLAVQVFAVEFPTETCDVKAFEWREKRNLAGLTSAVAKAETYWASLSPSARGRWQTRIGWSAWAPSIVSGKPDTSALVRYSSTLYGIDRTLSEPAFESLRRAFEGYLVTALALDSRPFCTQFEEKLALVVKVFQTTPLDYQQLSDLVIWLAATDQASVTRNYVSVGFQKAHFVAKAKPDLATRFAAAKGSQTIRKTFDRELNERTAIKGNSELNTTTKVTPVYSAGGLRFKIEVQGQWTSQDFQIVRSVSTMHASAEGKVTASAELFTKDGKVEFTEPAVSTSVELELLEVDADSTAINLLTRGRFRTAKPDIEKQTAAGIAKEFTEGFRRQLVAMAKKLEAQAVELTGFALALGLQPEVTSGVETGAMVFASKAHPLWALAAASDVARKLEDSEDISLSIHDSALPSLVRGLIGGAPWEDLDFAIAQRELTGSVEPEIRVAARGDRWGAQWNWLAPFRIHTTPSFTRYILRFDRFHVNGKTVETAFQVEADYRPRATDYGIELNRVGTTRVLAPASLDALSRSFLEAKFGDFLPSVAHGDTLSFPGGGNFHALSHYGISSIELEDGWFHFGIKPRP